MPAPAPVSSKAGSEPVRVLVTRPDPAARRTAQRLSDLGHLPVLLPLFETRFLEIDPALADGSRAALIFTSANAVKAVGRSLDKAFITSDIPVYTVGGATAHAARTAGFAEIRQGEGNGRDLARLIVADIVAGRLSPTARSPVIYLSAEDRRSDLEAELSAASVPLETAVVYRMEKISYSTDFILSHKMTPSPGAILLYSTNAARRFFELLSPQTLESSARGAIIACLSDEIAAACPPSLAGLIRVARSPDEAALLETIEGLR